MTMKISYKDFTFELDAEILLLIIQIVMRFI